MNAVNVMGVEKFFKQTLFSKKLVQDVMVRAGVPNKLMNVGYLLDGGVISWQIK